jgi:broad specificity phosphatase PhoE
VIEPNPPIYFVRHGETDWNREGRIQGQIDIPMNSAGHLQSEAVARGLKLHIGKAKIDRLISSPLLRARQTIGYLCRELDFPEERVEIAPAITELSFGVWEGRFFRELKTSADYPTDLLGHFYWRPKDGESYEDGLERIKQWTGRLDGLTVIVSHGAIGRCLIGLVSDLSPEDLVSVRTPQGSFCRLENGQIEWFDADGDADEL